jgi:hypothetical protein
VPWYSKRRLLGATDSVELYPTQWLPGILFEWAKWWWAEEFASSLQEGGAGWELEKTVDDAFGWWAGYISFESICESTCHVIWFENNPRNDSLFFFALFTYLWRNKTCHVTKRSPLNSAGNVYVQLRRRRKCHRPMRIGSPGETQSYLPF